MKMHFKIRKKMLGRKMEKNVKLLGAPNKMQFFQAMNNRVMRSSSVAKNPDWHDLGWAWGRRK
jgi:hypothetical protein